MKFDEIDIVRFTLDSKWFCERHNLDIKEFVNAIRKLTCKKGGL